MLFFSSSSSLIAGVFGSIEMRPGVVGTWMVECTIGDHHLSGMRAKFLVYNQRKKLLRCNMQIQSKLFLQIGDVCTWRLF